MSTPWTPTMDGEDHSESFDPRLFDRAPGTRVVSEDPGKTSPGTGRRDLSPKTGVRSDRSFLLREEPLRDPEPTVTRTRPKSPEQEFPCVQPDRSLSGSDRTQKEKREDLLTLEHFQFRKRREQTGVPPHSIKQERDGPPRE